METVNNLLDLLLYNVQSLYAAEELIQKLLPGIIEKARHNSLKYALKHHAALTDDQKKRLEEIVKLINAKKAGSGGAEFTLLLQNPNKAITGLIEEANELLQGNLSNEVTDAVIISAVQKMEQYEICTYGSAHAYANQLKLHTVAKLLNETLHEEYDADDLLTALATAAINKDALPEGLEASTRDKAISETIEGDDDIEHKEVSINERTINSPGGRAGTSHRGYGNGESRGH